MIEYQQNPSVQWSWFFTCDIVLQWLLDETEAIPWMQVFEHMTNTQWYLWHMLYKTWWNINKIYLFKWANVPPSNRHSFVSLFHRNQAALNKHVRTNHISLLSAKLSPQSTYFRRGWLDESIAVFKSLSVNRSIHMQSLCTTPLNSVSLLQKGRHCASGIFKTFPWIETSKEFLINIILWCLIDNDLSAWV